MSTEDSSAADRGSGFSAGLGALLARLRACADDPMWANHAEVPKALIADAANALEETGDIADHLMAQRDEERGRMADIACERISRAQTQGQLLPPEEPRQPVQEGLL